MLYMAKSMRQRERSFCRSPEYSLEELLPMLVQDFARRKYQNLLRVGLYETHTITALVVILTLCCERPAAIQVPHLGVLLLKGIPAP